MTHLRYAFCNIKVSFYTQFLLFLNFHEYYSTVNGKCFHCGEMWGHLSRHWLLFYTFSLTAVFKLT